MAWNITHAKRLLAFLCVLPRTQLRIRVVVYMNILLATAIQIYAFQDGLQGRKLWRSFLIGYMSCLYMPSLFISETVIKRLPLSCESLDAAVIHLKYSINLIPVRIGYNRMDWLCDGLCGWVQHGEILKKRVANPIHQIRLDMKFTVVSWDVQQNFWFFEYMRKRPIRSIYPSLRELGVLSEDQNPSPRYIFALRQVKDDDTWLL